MDLNHVNNLSDDQAKAQFLKCCGSERWAKEIARRRPFGSQEEFQNHLVECWRNMSQEDWLEAFSAHPRIGDVNTLREKYGATKDWAKSEQSGVDAASEQVIEELASFNTTYFEKFGFIFIVCATGKSADQMLAMLKERIDNPLDREMKIAMDEQKKITLIRLEKM